VRRDERNISRFAESNIPITGTVLEEVHNNNLNSVPEYNGLVSHSNETVSLDSDYTLKIQTDDGRVLGVSVIDGKETPAKKESLDVLIEEGSRVSFPQGNIVPGYHRNTTTELRDETYFTAKTQFGNKCADRITILPSN